MPETNFFSPAEINKKKPAKAAAGRKTNRRKTAGSAPFKLNENITINQVMPKATHKIKENTQAVKRGDAKSVYLKIAFSFVALTVILVIAVIYFGFAKATLTIIPTQEKITESLSVEVADKAVDFDSSNQNFISGIVRQAPVEQSRTFSSTGKQILGEEVSGKVTIVNNYMKNQPLVATTRLLSKDNKLFRLKNTVNVPAGGTVEVEVYADEAKPDMAIGPSRFTIPGLWAGLQDKVYAESKESMKYAEKVKYFIKQGDIDNAVSELKKDLLNNAKKEVAKAYEDYNQSILEVDNNSATFETQGKVGEEKEKFTVKMKTNVTVVAFKSNDIRPQAEAKLAGKLADDKEIIELNASEMTYNLGNIDIKKGVATVNVNFTSKIALKGSAQIIKKNNLTGLNEQELKAYLNSLPEVADYEIKFFPSFVKRAPNLVDRIEVFIKK